MSRQCHYCGTDVDPDHPSTWHVGSVWLKGRRRTETFLFRRLEKFACDSCIRKLRAGRHPQQESLM